MNRKLTHILTILLMVFIMGLGDNLLAETHENLTKIKTSAQRGSATAQFALALRYYKGKGVTKDYKEAFKWAQKAAVKKNAEAMHYLGLCYDNGYGVTQNAKKAFKWYHKAAEQGNINAQYSLGTCYYLGYGVTKDYKESTKWFRKAEKRKHESIQKNLAVCYSKKTVISKSSANATKSSRKVCKQANTKNKENLSHEVISFDEVKIESKKKFVKFIEKKMNSLRKKEEDKFIRFGQKITVKYRGGTTTGEFKGWYGGHKVRIGNTYIYINDVFGEVQKKLKHSERLTEKDIDKIIDDKLVEFKKKYIWKHSKYIYHHFYNQYGYFFNPQTGHWINQKNMHKSIRKILLHFQNNRQLSSPIRYQKLEMLCVEYKNAKNTKEIKKAFQEEVAFAAEQIDNTIEELADKENHSAAIMLLRKQILKYPYASESTKNLIKEWITFYTGKMLVAEVKKAKQGKSYLEIIQLLQTAVSKYSESSEPVKKWAKKWIQFYIGKMLIIEVRKAETEKYYSVSIKLLKKALLKYSNAPKHIKKIAKDKINSYINALEKLTRSDVHNYIYKELPYIKKSIMIFTNVYAYVSHFLRQKC